MYSNRADRKTFRFALCTAITATLVAGSVVANPFNELNAAARSEAKPEYSDIKAVAKAEKAVVKDPANAALRSELASAYLAEGRFASAAATYEDAIALGEASPRTALSLALAYIGTGRSTEARSLLNQWRDSIPASDFALALALAGDTTSGVNILSEQVRRGDSSAKVRQNLAYAYALHGRWLEARLMAAQDLPADQVDGRISEWAASARPEDYQYRVAGLLGAPVRADAGQPAFLALDGSRSAARPTMAEAPPAPPAYSGNPDRELPPVESGESFWGTENRDPTPLLEPVKSHAAAPPAPQPEAEKLTARASSADFEDAFAQSEAGPKFISSPVVQAISAQNEAAPRPAPPAQPQASTSSSGSTHHVQLGSFSSRENAERAWEIYKRRYPSLSDGDLRITEAVVRGKRYWRVAAAGYDSRSARSMCSSVRGSGHGCIAYAASRPLPGAVPSRSGSGPQLASRR